MLVDDAQKIAAAIEERLSTSACQGAKATVKSEEISPKTVPAGAGRPTFCTYFILIDDGARVATLTLGQAAALVDDVEPDWTADRLFEVIRAMDAPVDDRN